MLRNDWIPSLLPKGGGGEGGRIVLFIVILVYFALIAKNTCSFDFVMFTYFIIYYKLKTETPGENFLDSLQTISLFCSES